MARFDVYENPDGLGYLMTVQAGILDHLNTRMVVPLMPISESPQPARILNPIFTISGEETMMATQFMAAVPTAVLRSQIVNLEPEHQSIVTAIDFLLQGF
ncbi:MAG TPA: plasmid maintenance protein CcdB [Gammaproteobacteria bacterium]|jgi:toxin CcdB|nr:plasmid maintenance protein CcdB [Gammaproteobacteria bacterium]